MLRDGTIKRWFVGLLIANAACEPVDGNYTLVSSAASVDGNDRVVVDARVTNDGSDIWIGSRCVVVYWEAAPGVSRDQARSGMMDSTVQIIETQRQCAEPSHLDEGESDSFHIVSSHSRSELTGTVIVTVPQDTLGTAFDTRIVQPSP